MTEPETLATEPLGDLDDTKEVWTHLGERSRNVYLTWEWSSTWWEHFGSGELRLIGCRNPRGELRAILPLYRGAGRVRALRLLGHGHAPELGPVCAPEDVSAATRAFAQYLSGGPGDWDVFLAHDVNPYWMWGSRLGGSVLGQTASPRVELGGVTWEGYLATRTKSFRDDLRKNARRIERVHRLERRWTRDTAELASDLGALFSLHRGLWGADASPYFAGSEAFHRDFAARALDRGWLRLAVVEVDGRTVAANLGFRLGDVAWTHNAGRDPAVAGAGLLVTAFDIERSIEEGAAEYRLGPGASSFKNRFATVAFETETVGVPRSVVGRASLTARRCTRALPLRARVWLERLAA